MGEANILARFFDLEMKLSVDGESIGVFEFSDLPCTQFYVYYRCDSNFVRVKTI